MCVPLGLCVCLPVCVKWECQEDAWILGSGLCGKISQEASPLSSILQGEKERKQEVTSQVILLRRRGCVCNPIVWTHSNETVVGKFGYPVITSYPGYFWKWHSLNERIHCKLEPLAVEIKAMNRNISLLRLQSREQWLISHQGIQHWKSKVYCSQTLWTHRTFIWEFTVK